MKVGLYYVYDQEQECIISPLIPMKNDFNAGVGFANHYIRERDPMKNPYDYRQLVLVRFAIVQDSDKDMKIVDNNVKKWSGENIRDFVEIKMKERNIDDFFVDEKAKE